MKRSSLASPLDPSHSESRSTWRIPVAITGDLGNSRFGKRKVQLVDISSGGCRVETTMNLPQGTTLVITIPGLAPMSCEVKWSGRDGMGLRFAAPLHAGVISHIQNLR